MGLPVRFPVIRLVMVTLFVVSVLPMLAGLGGVMANAWNAGAWVALGATPGLARAALLSLWTGLAAAAISLALAHLALALARTGGWGPRLRGSALPLLATPHLAMSIGIALAIAPSGLILRLLSPWATGFTQPPDWTIIQDPQGLALIAGLVVKETAFLVLVLFMALSQVPSERLLLQARTLGYGPLKAWLTAVAPLLQRQIRLPLAAVVVFGVTNVEVALPLGPATPPTLATILWSWFVHADPRQQQVAFAGAVLLVLVAGVALLATRALAAFAGRAIRAWSAGGARAIHETGTRYALAALLLLPFGLGLLALIALALRSFPGPARFPAVFPTAPELGPDASANSQFPPGLGSSLALGLIVTVVAVALVLVAVETLRDRPGARRLVGFGLYLPLVVPQIAFLFGWQVLLVRFGLDGTALAILWSHLIFVLPYAWGLLAEARSMLDPRYGLGARLLGARPARVWLTVTLPLLLRPTLASLAFGFAVSVALYLPTLFAGAGRIATLATEAAAAIASGNLHSAALAAASQALLPLAGFLFVIGLAGALHRHRLGVPR